MKKNATVNYHIHSNDRQSFHFDVDGILGNLISPELVPTKVIVQDIRNNSSFVNFEKDGIAFENHSTNVNDFVNSSNWEDTYNDELKTILHEKINAKDVIVFDHTIRIDDPDTERRPARNVHNDYNKKGAEQRLRDILEKNKAEQFMNGHYGFVNVWRPIENPIMSTPLGFIHPDSMDEKDWMTIDLIYPNEVREILGVNANKKHDWFYLSKMDLNEVAMFNTYDNKGRPFLAHSALDMEETSNFQSVRKSIESRTIVRYK